MGHVAIVFNSVTVVCSVAWDWNGGGGGAQGVGAPPPSLFLAPHFLKVFTKRSKVQFVAGN